jgi:hypothetical protein
MIALMCGCGRRLEADEGERLCERVAAHLDRDHMSAHVYRELVQGMVASRGYRVEYATVYTNGAAPDEEFGPEPY